MIPALHAPKTKSQHFLYNKYEHKIDKSQLFRQIWTQLSQGSIHHLEKNISKDRNDLNRITSFYLLNRVYTPRQQNMLCFETRTFTVLNCTQATLGTHKDHAQRRNQDGSIR